MNKANSINIEGDSIGPAAVIISDFRPEPVAAALQLFKKRACKYLLCSDMALTNIEYGGIDSIFTKKVYALFLKIVFGLEIVRSSRAAVDVSRRSNNGILSSLVSRTNDFVASEQKYPDIYRQLEAQDVGASQLWRVLQERNVSEIFIFNGRLASTNILARNAEQAGIKCHYYEYIPRDSSGFRLFPFSVHRAKLIAETVLERHALAENSGEYVLDEVRAESIIKKKIDNKFAQLARETMEKGFDYAIFLSSPHELKYVAVEGTDDIEFLRTSLQEIPNSASVCIRIHPNMRRDPSYFEFEGLLEEFREIHPNFEVISAFDGTNSHDLIRNSKHIVTNYSSIAIDAALLKDDWASITAKGGGFSKFLLEYVSSKEMTIYEKRLLLALLFDECMRSGEQRFDIVGVFIRKLLRVMLLVKALR